MTEVQKQIDRVAANISDTYTEIEVAGGAVPTARTSDNLPSTVANALANAGENLDAVLEEQATLISQIATALDGKAASGGEDLDEVLEEQATLISQIATALDSKAAGGGAAKKTVTVTVTNASSQTVYYVDAAGSLCKVYGYSSATTVEAMGGILYYRQALGTNLTGSYFQYQPAESGLQYQTVFVFLEDGGTMHCLDDNGSGGQ